MLFHCGCAGGQSELVVIVGTWKCLICIGVMTDVIPVHRICVLLLASR
jgi:hypothetical protein